MLFKRFRKKRGLCARAGNAHVRPCCKDLWWRTGQKMCRPQQITHTVEGLYCKRPIQGLASSEILTPPPPPSPHRPASVYPRLWCGGRTHWLGGEGVGGWSIARKTLDTAVYSIYVSTLWHTQSGESPGWGGGGGVSEFKNINKKPFIYNKYVL